MNLAKDVTTINLDHHVTARLGADVCSIAAPLKYIGFEHFSLHRIYSDRSRITLTTHVDFSNYFLRKEFYELGICGFHGDYVRSCFSWAQLRRDSGCGIIFDAIEAREMLESGYTFVEPQSFYTDIVYFGKRKSSANTIANRADFLGLLEKFVLYFCETGKNLIAQAAKERIFFPKCAQVNILKAPKKNNIQIDKFLKNLHSEYRDKIFRLSAREQQCAEYIKLGYSPKEISLILNISYRTVEKHIANIKSTFGVKTVSRLISLLIKMS